MSNTAGKSTHFEGGGAVDVDDVPESDILMSSRNNDISPISVNKGVYCKMDLF